MMSKQRVMMMRVEMGTMAAHPQPSGKGLLYLGYTWVDLVLSRLSKLSRASQDASKAVKAI